MIQLEEIDLKSDVVDSLFRLKLIGKDTQQLLQQATHECDGYIAGGFASLLAKLNFEKNHGYDEFKIRDYLGGIHSKFIEKLEQNRLHKGRLSDIDVWFTNDNELAKFISLPKPPQVVVKNSMLGWALEFYCEKPGVDSTYHLVQVITKLTGTFENVVSNFDIYNAACVIKGSKLYVPIGFRELVKMRQLHLQNWGGIYSIKRLSSWSKKQGYLNVTKETTDLFNSNIMSFLNDVHNNKIQSYGKPLKSNEVIASLFKRCFYMLSIENMLMLSNYLPPSTYWNSTNMLAAVAKKQEEIDKNKQQCR